jgi:hypothetical protein
MAAAALAQRGVADGRGMPRAGIAAALSGGRRTRRPYEIDGTPESAAARRRYSA